VGSESGGFVNAMKVLEVSRPLVAACSLGSARQAVDMAVKYSKERIQFGKPICSFQAIQLMLADMEMRTNAAGRWSTTPPCSSTRASRAPRKPPWPNASRPTLPEKRHRRRAIIRRLRRHEGLPDRKAVPGLQDLADRGRNQPDPEICHCKEMVK
jgi:alkylation response protein AidB-like acyl-CoA dehydrogenase